MSQATHSVRLQASDVHFPDCCAGCDGPAEVSFKLTAERGVELWIVSWFSWIDLELPLCRRCRWRRRLVASALPVGILLALAAMFIVAGLVTGDNIPDAAAVIMGVITFAMVLVYRWQAGRLTDFLALGLRARLLRGEGSPVELRFRRTEYFLRWAALNRGVAGSEPVLR